MLDCVELQTTEHPNATVIVLHGLGADGYDFVPIVKEFESLGAPRARYVFPHAPQMPVTINNGYVMRAWYDILGSDLVRREDERGLRQSQAAVEALIEREVARGVPRRRIVLTGFSQGGAITLQVGLRQPEPLAGLIVLSSYLPLSATLAAELMPAAKGTPIFMAHGTQDPVVPLERGTQSRDQLQHLGLPVEWHDYPMAHSVCGEEVEAIAAFLKRVLG
ncbi:MAG: alpha/beta fold hydrolase [Burkholderiales bacterium]|jgi:phospholipase/carboxylesterase|nr:alpha/beta fold hydrolase [Burkholderiales bacterium]